MPDEPLTQFIYEMTDRVNSFRPVYKHEDKKKDGTKLPANACVHQKRASPKDVRARIGLTANGSACCSEAVFPTEFAVENLEDKGEIKRGSGLAFLTPDQHRQFSNWLVIRYSSFSFDIINNHCYSLEIIGSRMSSWGKRQVHACLFQRGMLNNSEHCSIFILTSLLASGWYLICTICIDPLEVLHIFLVTY